ncbi:hypothetical protein A9Q84_12230 [Halobacteriovorax marinus]|uniref:Transglutaminase-like domain-containing protein n=1 Tax=Halobacteriovorax marinus TaxID=97084 RepID=A0A1Y5FES7_9BACT|nr:hypothetical protein A9Q84_12230 [Halobacteriovorax marinus]
MFNHIYIVSLLLYFILTLCFSNYFSASHLIFFGAIFSLLVAQFKFQLRYLSWLRLPLLFGGTYLIYIEYGTWKGIGPASTLFSLLVLLKLFELKNKRDLYSLISIFILYLLSLSLLVEDFYYLGVILAAMFSCFYLLFSAEQLEIEDYEIGFSLKKILLLFFQAAPLIVLLMIFFPRLHFGGFFFSKNVAKTGFSEHLEPGNISELVKDSSSIFDASFNKKMKSNDLYWRGLVLIENDEFSWKKGIIPERRSSSPTSKKPGYYVNFHELTLGALFTLSQTGRVKLTSAGALRKNKAGTFSSSPLMNQKTKFIGYFEEISKANLKENYQSTYLQLSIQKSEPLQELVRNNKHLYKLSEQTKDFLVNFFKKDFRYSLSPGSYTGSEALNDFLFKRKLGFCGHFAAASAVLFRTFGIPARVVVGYQGGSYNEVGDFYVITQRDAHSWVEYLGDDGVWKRFDAVEYVAPERINFGGETYFELERLRSQNLKTDSFFIARSSMVGKFRQYLETLYYKSGTLFFNYDLELQKKLFTKLRTTQVSLSYSLKILSLFLFLSCIGICLFKTAFLMEFILFLIIFKKQRIKWSDYRYLTIDGINLLLTNPSKKFSLLLSFYQDVKYSGNASITRKLSFILKGLRILIYD